MKRTLSRPRIQTELELGVAFGRKASGAYFTPNESVQSLVKWAVRRPSDRLLDPSCGDGRFLAQHRRSVGIEQNPASAAEAIQRAPGALIHEGDFFAWSENTKERFECAAGNPPFIRYQRFVGETRSRALSLCAKLGANFSGLTSSWAPFLVATASLLKLGGRIAFVVPAEIGHAPYAKPLLEYLLHNFSHTQIIAIKRKLFSELSEDCWLLYADGYGGQSTHLHLTLVDTFIGSNSPPNPTVSVSICELRDSWNMRIRPFCLPGGVRELYLAAAASRKSFRLGDVASIGIGYVSGDNEFFHLRPSWAERFGIPNSVLRPSVRNGRSLPDGKLTKEVVSGWYQADEQMLLLNLSGETSLPASVRLYLDTEAGHRAREAYKCRTREPWYRVPDVRTPDYFMSYMSGLEPSLVRNVAGCTCTNSVHSVQFKRREAALEVERQWQSHFVQLSCELEGHALGGGMLKLEPREAARILIPDSRAVAEVQPWQIESGIRTMREWRHYGAN